MAIAAVSIAPTGDGPSVSRHVAAALAVLEGQDKVRWKLDSMFTTLEGEVEEVFAVIRRMQEAVFAEGAVRVGTVIKIDERRDKAMTMEGKVLAAEAALADRAG
ncbi:MAG: MTH1187 family thiamine-binding protein [Myxococcota bacterium]|nr:MTH1187 family thiamine-binding protein [Myxococcota bacterium]